MNRHIQNPILVAARGNIVAASDKMHALQREALRIGELVERGEIQGEDAKKELLAAAEAARICGTDKGREDAANVINKGLAGITALPDKMAKEAKHDHVGHLDHLARQKPNSYTVVLRGIAEVKPEPVNWLWPGRIALGKVSLIFGEPGIGKSQLSLDIAARVSKGAPWPDRGQAPAGDVVILASEDGIADTVRPRLDVAGADVGRIHFVEAVKGTDGGHLTFDLAAHLRDLEVKMAELAGRTRLVIIDPITSFMGR